MSSTPSFHSLPNSKRSSAATSPARRPLQERSDSDTNERVSITAPTIRVVADNGPGAYSKSPFPTDPAHFLPPRPADYAGERTVSDENAPSISVTSPPLELLEPRFALGIRPGSRVSTSTSASRVSSDADTLPVNASLSPSLSSRFSITTTSPSTPTLTSLTVNDEDAYAATAKLSPAPGDPPSKNASQSTIRLIVPSNYPPPRSANLPLGSHPTRLPDTPSASFPSASALIAHWDRRSTPPEALQIYPTSVQSGTARSRPNSGSTSSENPQSPPAKSKQAQPWTIVTSSTDSLDSDASYPPALPLQRPRSASSPPSTSHASSRGTVESAQVQFPQVRSASASGSWATVSAQPAPQEARMNDSANRLSIWSSRLSTIPSESEPGSHSNVSSGPPSDQAQRSPRLRRVIGSIASDASRSEPSESSLPMRPPPLFSGAAAAPRDLPPVPPAPARDSEEGNDTVGELQAPVLRPQRSGYLARVKGALSRPGSSESLKSQMSFQGELSWVRPFYRSGEWSSFFEQANSSTDQSSRLNTATSGTTTSPLSDRFPAEIWRPRNRPPLWSRGRTIERGRPEEPRDAPAVISEVGDEAVSASEEGAAATHVGTWRQRWGRRPLWRSPSSANGSGVVSPHLHPDRRATMMLNAWSTPSFDEPFSRRVFTPLNRQIALFCVGFIFPLAWIAAACLPLQPKPTSFEPHQASRAVVPPGQQATDDDVYLRNHPSVLADVEKEERRYLKAKWWRMLNRIMCVVGLVVIALIISLTVVGLKMR